MQRRSISIAERKSVLHLKHLHYLIAEVVDDLYGDAAGLGFVEGTRGVAV